MANQQLRHLLAHDAAINQAPQRGNRAREKLDVLVSLGLASRQVVLDIWQSVRHAQSTGHSHRLEIDTSLHVTRWQKLLEPPHYVLPKAIAKLWCILEQSPVHSQSGQGGPNHLGTLQRELLALDDSEQDFRAALEKHRLRILTLLWLRNLSNPVSVLPQGRHRRQPQLDGVQRQRVMNGEKNALRVLSLP